MAIEKEGVEPDRLSERESAVAAACLFNGFADPTRTLIIQHLLSGEHNVKALVEHLGLAQSTVSAHLSCLLDCDVVSRRSEGRAAYYSLAHPELTLRLLEAAQEFLAATGSAAIVCPNKGADTLPHIGE